MLRLPGKKANGYCLCKTPRSNLPCNHWKTGTPVTGYLRRPGTGLKKGTKTIPVQPSNDWLKSGLKKQASWDFPILQPGTCRIKWQRLLKLSRIFLKKLVPAAVAKAHKEAARPSGSNQ